jgi:hypothetical protein
LSLVQQYYLNIIFDGICIVNDHSIEECELFLFGPNGKSTFTIKKPEGRFFAKEYKNCIVRVRPGLFIMTSSKKCYALDLLAERITEIEKLNEKKKNYEIVMLNDGRLLTFGNLGGGYGTMEIMDSDFTWHMLESNPPFDELILFSACVLKDGRVLIMGGATMDDLGLNVRPLNDCYIYDPLANVFNKVSSMRTRRFSFACLLLPNGNVFVCGGHGRTIFENNGLTFKKIDYCEEYNVSLDKWEDLPNMNEERCRHGCLLLNDKETILVYGDEKVLNRKQPETFNVKEKIWRNGGYKQGEIQNIPWSFFNDGKNIVLPY